MKILFILPSTNTFYFTGTLKSAAKLTEVTIENKKAEKISRGISPEKVEEEKIETKKAAKICSFKEKVEDLFYGQ